MSSTRSSATPSFQPSAFPFPAGFPPFISGASAWETGWWPQLETSLPRASSSTPTSGSSTPPISSSSGSTLGLSSASTGSTPSPSSASTGSTPSPSSASRAQRPAAGINVPMIVGIVVPLAVILLAVLGLLLVLRHRRRRVRQDKLDATARPFKASLFNPKVMPYPVPVTEKERMFEAKEIARSRTPRSRPINPPDPVYRSPHTHEPETDSRQNEYGALRSQTEMLVARVTQLEELVVPERGNSPPSYQSEAPRHPPV